MQARTSEEVIGGILPEHTEALLRLQRLLHERRSFTMCFLTYSDSSYREKVADVLEELLGARARVAISGTSTGTEALFEMLGTDREAGPAQLTGLESWPEGMDDLLTRLNHRRGALAKRCSRPILVWIPSMRLRQVATVAADLWAWRSGVFDFGTPGDVTGGHFTPVGHTRAMAPARPGRVEDLKHHLAGLVHWRPIDVDLALELGDFYRFSGDLEGAEAVYRDARSALTGLDDERRNADAMGRIADILESRGELDEAYRIRTQEQLPVYERLGETRSAAIAWGGVADILTIRGELDEAFRIRSERQVPVFARIADERELAITQGQLADILEKQGELDEAFRIRTEEQLPVFERIGDAREQAIAQGQVAAILAARGELDEALRIHTEEQLPVFEQLGDVREQAITQGQIADVLAARGELDGALRIRREEQLPVFERLGDLRGKAIVQGQIADILTARGELKEALRIRKREEIPSYASLGAAQSLAAAREQAAELMAGLGQTDQALLAYEKDVLPAFHELMIEDAIKRVRKRIESLRAELRA